MTDNTLVRRAVNKTFPGFEKENESKWKGPFSFIQASDTQLGMIDSYILKKAEDFVTWDEEMASTRRAIEAVNALTPRPRFFVVCGDLIDAMPGTRHRLEQEQDFIKVFHDLHPDIPLVCVCGNHDIGNTPTEASIQQYRHRFGDDYFSFFCAGVMFIVLNSQFYEDSSLVMSLAEQFEQWLDEQLQEAKTGGYKHIIVFQHIPWFVDNPDEEKIYFNIEINLRKKMLQKFYNANVRTIFCGHYHRNAGGFYKDMELVVTSAIGAQLGKDKSGIRIVKVLEDAVLHEYYEIDKVPKQINL